MYNIDGKSHRVSPEVDAMIVRLRSDLAAAERERDALRRAFATALEHLPPCLCNVRFSIRGKCQGDCVIAAMTKVAKGDK